MRRVADSWLRGGTTNGMLAVMHARFACALALLLAAHAAGAGEERRPIVLRAAGVPDVSRTDIGSLANRAVIEAFREQYPGVAPVPATGITIPNRAHDLNTLMQIAGDVAPDVLHVNFRNSETYIRSRFLSPLDRHVEQLAGVTLPDSHLLPGDAYVRALRLGPGYAREFEERVPEQCWPVMRRECPYGLDCPYVRAWQGRPAARHEHVWCFPIGPSAMALFYRRDLLLEAGLPDRTPATIAEMLDWCRRLTCPPEDRYGLNISLRELGWSTLSFLYSQNGRIVTEDAPGQWRCTFDSDQAVEAYYQVARFFVEPFTNRYGRWRGVVYLGEPRGTAEVRYAMFFSYLDTSFFASFEPAQFGFGPVPAGADGTRGAEFNATLAGLYAGLEDDPARLEAAWNFVRFYDGPEARLIRARTLVENGLSEYVRPKLLVAAGFPDLVRQVPAGWDAAAAQALATGVPEPYGRNCQQVYRYVSQALDQIRTDDEIRAAMDAGDAARAKTRIRTILRDRVRRANEKMLNLVTPEERAFRSRVAAVVAVIILLVFAAVFHRVFRIFAQAEPEIPGRKRRAWAFGRYRLAYLLLLPALASILLWHYWPLAQGTTIAFQDYGLRGQSAWVGLDNFAAVLFDAEFWFSVGVAVEYALLFMVFGFVAPIVLAFMLAEVPRGKVAFRTLYYLPAVLTGVVAVFLWKSFYGQYGMINKVLNIGLHALNLLPGVALPDVTTAWLDSRSMALFFCLLPTIWAGMGPGCLIYLAALKTIPEELYEAADVDGAGIRAKVRHIALPGIRSLIAINFIGAMIGAMHTGGGFILAMTGGGPYTPYGRTEVVGLHIFWEAFMFLRFGTAAAMAWVIGAMLIGFTVLQLQRLSRMEFRTARGTDN